MPAVAVVLDTPERLCRDRNRERARPVPAPALAAQLRKVRELDLTTEGWDEVRRITVTDPGVAADPRAPVPGEPQPSGLGFVLQLSRFRWER